MQIMVQKCSVFSALGGIVGGFATFEGWPLYALNAHSFVGEPLISVWNASNCCRVISLSGNVGHLMQAFLVRTGFARAPTCAELFLLGIYQFFRLQTDRENKWGCLSS